MRKLKADKSVLAALAKAFPKPNSAASKALDKYLTVLGQQFDQAVLNGRTPEQIKLGLYGVSLHHMMQKGGQIGPDRVRLHKWLKENNLELIKTVTKGSNLTGKLSEVVPTSLLSITKTSTPAPRDCMIETVKSHHDIAGSEIISRLYPELSGGFDEEAFCRRYDTIDVDMKSLDNYIDWLSEDSQFISHQKRERALAQARLIMAVADELDGKFIQRKLASEFGRTYYEGTSIQNVNRMLRSAILGNCWEYDIRSSVICWKMGYAKRLIKQCAIATSVEDAFKFTLFYIDHKKEMTAAICHEVFASDTKVPKQLQGDLIKEAFTAISFGARALEAGWKDDTGQWKNSALVQIIRNTGERKRFLADHAVKRFVAEQNMLDRFIFAHAMSHVPELSKVQSLQTVSGKPSKAKVLAYLYQHAETMVMDEAAAVATANDHLPIARVHDAIFFRHSLGERILDKITWAMRDKSGNQYWSLKPEKISRFEKPAKFHTDREAAHKKLILEEELRALKYQQLMKSAEFFHLGM